MQARSTAATTVGPQMGVSNYVGVSDHIVLIRLIHIVEF